MSGIAQRLQPFEDRRRLERAFAPLDRDPLAREIDPRAPHTRFALQSLFDRHDTGAAVDSLDDQIHRRDPLDRVSDEKRKVLRFRHRP